MLAASEEPTPATFRYQEPVTADVSRTYRLEIINSFDIILGHDCCFSCAFPMYSLRF